MFEKMNWELLRQQKQWLLENTDSNGMSDGLVNLLDALQDYAVESGLASESEVFALE